MDFSPNSSVRHYRAAAPVMNGRKKFFFSFFRPVDYPSVAIAVTHNSHSDLDLDSMNEWCRQLSYCVIKLTLVVRQHTTLSMLSMLTMGVSELFRSEVSQHLDR